MNRFQRGAIGAILAAACTVPAVAAWAQARPGAPQTFIPGLTVGRTEALAGALVGSGAGVNALTAYLDGGGGLPDDVRRRAVELINELQRGDLANDPVVLQQAADRIAEAASRSLRSAQIVQMQLDQNFSLGPGRIGLDFGPPSGPTQPGFIPVGPNSALLGPGENQMMRRPGGDPLMLDGVRGVREIRVPGVPNGPVRVILMTDAYTDDDVASQPFGQEVSVNGEVVRVARKPPSAWIPGGFLTAPGNFLGDNAPTVNPNGIGNNTGGALIINAMVTNGVLVVNMRPAPGRTTYLTDMIIEPATTQSVVYGTGPARAVLQQYRDGGGPGSRLPDRVLNAEAEIQQAVGNLLSNVASAAGPGALRELLSLPDPVIDPGTLVSEN